MDPEEAAAAAAMDSTTGTPRSQSTGRSRRSSGGPATPASVRTNGEVTVSTQQSRQGSQATRPSLRNHRAEQEGGGDGEAAPQEAVISPELLVDALSGHEDGLLAIAERLMEHYDRGYDVMGEAIIDAFADVQKLFQHVVEAAHMEGAAFEASRREEEMQDLRRQAAQAGENPPPPMAAEEEESPASPAGPVRHDEFIDQDVKDCLNQAIRDGAKLKEANKHLECFELYERACQSASALLPVDSDHRGRLQLSIARADSMSPDRGCAILRYAMDDVLRSGLKAGKIPLPDPSKRADVVLSKPKVHPSMNGSTGQAGVVQSSEEQLNSLVEEMKEILEAPVYKDTPLQDVAKRFWVALNDTQKQQNRNEERLEQNLGKLKGDFLLARAVSDEWELGFLPMVFAHTSSKSINVLSQYLGMGREAQQVRGANGTTQEEVLVHEGRQRLHGRSPWHVATACLKRHRGRGKVHRLSFSQLRRPSNKRRRIHCILRKQHGSSRTHPRWAIQLHRRERTHGPHSGY